MTWNPREAAGFMKEAGDASELYQQAVAACEARLDSLELFRDRGKLKSSQLEEVQDTLGLLVKARVMQQGGVLAAKTDEVVAYGVRRGPVYTVKCLGDVAVRLGRLYQLD